jgi:sulfate/thiosulfate transport system permease protein
MRSDDPDKTIGPGAAAPAGAGAPGNRRSAVEWLLIAVAVLYALALLVGPLAAICVGAFAHGVSALVRELTSPSAINALKLTMLLSVGATVLNTVFGTCVAWVLVRDDFPGKRLVNGLVDLPFAVSPVIAGFMIMLLFGRGGWLTPVADAFGLKVVFALPGMLLATTFVSLPFVIREVMPVLDQIGVDQENAAYTMGASRWQTFWRVTLPSIRWGVFYGVSLTFARALGEFGAVLVVSGGVAKLTETSTLFIYRSLDDRNEVGAFAMALALAVVSFCMLLAMEFFKKHTQEE